MKELNEEVLFSVVLSIVKNSQNNILHKPVRPILWHLENQLCKVVWIRLKKVEQMLICLKTYQASHVTSHKNN